MSPPRKKKTPESDSNQQQLLFSAVVTTPPATGHTETAEGGTKQAKPARGKETSEKIEPHVYTVSQLTWLLEGTIQQDPVLGGKLVVQGELSNVKQSSRGHIYFTLRDEGAGISGIIWASTAARLSFDLESGIEVYVTGKLEIYKANGTYSIVCSKIEPVGIGALQLAFQQTKARLEAEGLFLEELKKPIPEFPQRIGIVTSRTGAVIHDMLRVIRRKNPLVDVLIAPVKVQGDGACNEIAMAISELNDPAYDLDVIIVARGGGSFEDLFCFSEEPVVRAIFYSAVPIVTGIGHEPDFGLADAAADYSASTPTGAAEMVVPDVQALVENLRYQAQTLLEEMADVMLEGEQTLDWYATRLVESHEFQLDAAERRVTQIQERLIEQSGFYFHKQDQRLSQWASGLDCFSPLDTLARGYAVALKDGQAVSKVAQLAENDSLTLRLLDGQARCTVNTITANPDQPQPG